MTCENIPVYKLLLLLKLRPLLKYSNVKINNTVKNKRLNEKKSNLAYMNTYRLHFEERAQLCFYFEK